MVIDIQYQLPLVRERRRRGGWAHLRGQLGSGELSGHRRPCANEGSRAWKAERERSASTHAMHLKLCMLAMKWGARRQLRELYGARGSIGD
eukprot:5622196-Pleurochrysis_carterae.AAC.1